MTLSALITEAEALAGADDACVALGHVWTTDGGRACPRGGDGSQNVYRCRRCDDYDYGEPGGPGWQDCAYGHCDCHGGRGSE